MRFSQASGLAFIVASVATGPSEVSPGAAFFFFALSFTVLPTLSLELLENRARFPCLA